MAAYALRYTAKNHLGMKLFGYLVFRFFVFLFWLMPFWLMYLLSDLVALLLQYVIGYRKKVAIENLRHAFPERSEAERRQILRDSYKNLADILLEGIKSFSMSKQQIMHRYDFPNKALVNQYTAANGNSVMMAAHYTNWEWGVIALPYFIERTVIGFYKPLSNKMMDGFVRKRHQGGTRLVSIANTAKAFDTFKDEPSAYVFVSDQSTWSEKAHEVVFLNQVTKCPYGGDKYARQFDFPVFFLNIQRKKRGFYYVEIELLAEKAGNLPEGEITRRFYERIEKLIVEQPADWLWSHRRWKNLR
jgi:Kdo2-lipid IVA lauroyltransferase/acyltransferase